LITRRLPDFDENSLLELGSGAYERDEFGPGEFAPAVLGGLSEFERHRESRHPRTRTFGDFGAEPHGRERRLDRFEVFK